MIHINTTCTKMSELLPRRAASGGPATRGSSCVATGSSAAWAWIRTPSRRACGSRTSSGYPPDNMYIILYVYYMYIICICRYTYVYVCIYIYIYVCLHVCVYIYIYTHVYIYIYVQVLLSLLHCIVFCQYSIVQYRSIAYNVTRYCWTPAGRWASAAPPRSPPPQFILETIIYIYTYIYIYIHMYIYIHIHICIHTYTCVYIYIPNISKYTSLLLLVRKLTQPES